MTKEEGKVEPSEFELECCNDCVILNQHLPCEACSNNYWLKIQEEKFDILL